MNWTCNDTRHSMLRELELPEEAIEHLAICELCQQVSDVATVASQVNEEQPLDLEQLLSSTQYQLSREHGVVAWLRSRPLSLQFALGLCATFVPVGLQLVLARRADIVEFPLPRLLVFAIAYSMVIAYAAMTLLTPLYRTRVKEKVWFSALLAAAVPVLFVVTNQDIPPAAGTTLSAARLEEASHCLRYGVLLAIPGVALLFTMDRAGSRRRLTSLVLAALGGAVGNFVLLLHCANPSSLHQFLGHVLVGVVLLPLIGIAGTWAKTSPWR